MKALTNVNLGVVGIEAGPAANVRVGIDEPWHNGLTGHVDVLGVGRDLNIRHRTDSGDLAVFHEQHALFNGLTRNGQQFGSDKGLRLSR